MNIIFVLAMAMFIDKSGSQVLTKSPACFSNGDTLTLSCETPALNETISFTFNGGNKGGCVLGLGCGAGITQTGTTTSLSIPQYNDTEHGGSWRCTFGSSPSSIEVIAENPCPTVTTEMFSASTNKDRTTQSPSTDTSHTEKTETTNTPITEKELTSAYLTPISKVTTTTMKTLTVNSTNLSVEKIIAVFFGIVFVFCFVILVIFCCRNCERKHTRNSAIKKTFHKPRQTKVLRSHEVIKDPIDKKYDKRTISATHDNIQPLREYIPQNYPPGHHQFLQSFPSRIVNGNDIYVKDTSNQNMRGYNRGQHFPLPLRYNDCGPFFTSDYCNRKCSQNMSYEREHVPDYYQGFIFYPGYNGIQKKQFRDHY